jgi:uncharacterized DUF497 family protein
LGSRELVSIKWLALLENIRTVSTVRFEWDPIKDAGNELKHGRSLAAASAIWSGSVVTLPSKNPGEARHLAIGVIEGHHWTVVFTIRGDVIRLISARRSRDDEKTIYEKHLG